MEEDEQLGRITAKRYRQVLDEKLAQFEGELINTYGDGSLCIFPSAVQAVRCASAVQQVLRQDPVVPLRISLHMGDIVIDQEELYGASINATSRIESMGVAGSVLVSDTTPAARNQPWYPQITFPVNTRTQYPHTLFLRKHFYSGFPHLFQNTCNTGMNLVHRANDAMYRHQVLPFQIDHQHRDGCQGKRVLTI